MTASKRNSKRNTLSKEIQEISKLYFVAMKHVNGKDVLHDSGELMDDYSRYIIRVRNAYQQLDDLEKSIINNEFFYEDYPNWWKKIFSRSTFFRLKKQSMLKFKEAFDNA